jgi:formylglycine-generating enzyme required for sulfatase activity/tRNA A-37 threonylcarbamoyl transferase component Bud32
MGVVYLAQNKLMGRKEVLKVVSRELMDRRGVLDRFLREIRNAAQLHHTNIVTAYSAIRAGETVAFAMEHVEGEDLASYVKTQGPLPVAHACYFAYQAALGLQYAHEKGMVHRDIKPGNLILARQGRRAVVKVLDFGLAKASREERVDKGLTHEGQMLGTPDYIAPEQSLDATKADIRADIYSLGCTLYYLLTGGPPFQAPSLYEVLQALHSQEAKPLNLVRAEVSPELAAVVSKMMAKDPKSRYQTPIEVAQAIKPFFKTAPGEQAARTASPSRTMQPGSDLAEARPNAAPTDAVAGVAPTPTIAAESFRADAEWMDPLVRVEDDAFPTLATPVAATARGVRAFWLSTAIAAVLLVGLAIAWAAGTRDFEAMHATLTLEDVPADAVVEIDGERKPVESSAVKQRQIAIKAGKHAVVVKHGGEILLAETIAAEAGRPHRLSLPRRKAVLPDRRETRTSEPKLLDTWTSPSTGMAFVRIEGGQFLMGSPDSDSDADDNEKPQHKVRIRPLYLGVTEVTQAQYAAVMGKNPSWFRPDRKAMSKLEGQATHRHPVEYITWSDAVKFCNAMSAADGLAPYYDFQGNDQFPEVAIPDRGGTGYRLPTEAEWEYACRAGTSTKYSFGNDPSKIGEYAWTGENSLSQSHPVRQKLPNPFGLYDMHGNVWEWCWDGYDPGYYRNSAELDPAGPESAKNRVARGGCWLNQPGSYCRSAVRSEHEPGKRFGSAGIRVARNPPAETSARPPSVSTAQSRPPPAPGPLPSSSPAAPALTGPKLSLEAPKRPGPLRRSTPAWKSPFTAMEFVRVPGGEFMMGSPDDDQDAKNDEKPQHRVRISTFYLGATEVTQAQYRAVMGNNPSHFSSTGSGKEQVAGQATDDFPVENLSWVDAIRFCNAMSRRDHLLPYYAEAGRLGRQDVRVSNLDGTGYRLPTEAEWEFACRAGTTTRYFFGDGPSALDGYAWHAGNSGSMTHPVARKHPNALGLYDMYGNVWEWCWDWHLVDYYRNAPLVDPQGPVQATTKVGHGGSWAHDPRGCRSATRDYTAPVRRDKNLGFRVARNQPRHPGQARSGEESLE